MKRISMLTFALIAFFGAFAQQAIWGVMPFVTPEVNPDKTVTFRFSAPKAVRVQVTGDFLPTQKITTPYDEFDAPGVADLVEGEKGVWQYTTPTPLAPELYSYSIIVDGLKVNDPANVYQLRDVVSITNIFIVPGDRADLYMVNKVPHGTVSKVWYHSDVLNLDRRLTVYTPAGYETSKRRYPVLYLLHGMGGDENAWTELGRASQIFDNLIAQGKMEPAIVVMTNGNSSQEAAPGETSNNLVQPTTQLPNKWGDFETHFPEVVKYIDKVYRTKAQKSSRAIAGLSMGGYHSFHISKQYPDMFDYVGLFSAAVATRDNSDSPIYQDLEKKLEIQFKKKPKLYWIGIGNTDFLFEENVKLRQLLDANNYPYTYYESPEGHIWKNWRIYLTEFAPLLFK